MDNTNNPRSQVDGQPYTSLMSNVPSDEDIEGILNEISEILAAQSADNSECTDSVLLDSNRSVEDILKDAENLVCSSLAHLDESKRNYSRLSALNKKQPETIIKSSHSRSSHNSVKFSDVTETIPFQDTRISTFKTRSKSDPDIVLSNQFDKVERVEEKPKSLRVDTPQDTSAHSTEARSIMKETVERKVEKKRKSDIHELKLSDLATVYEDGNTPVDPEETDVFDEDVGNKSPANNNAHNSNTYNKTVVCNSLELEKNNNDGEINDNSFVTANIDTSNNKLIMCAKNENESFEKTENKLTQAERNRLALLEEEVISQEELIASYQRENQRLCSDIINAKESWKETEMKLVEKVRNSEQQRVTAIQKSNHEISNLKEKLRVAEETIAILQLELKTVKEEKSEVDKMNEELTIEVTRLNCEIEEYKREMEDWKKAEKEKIAAMESNATIQGKLSQANTEVTRKQTEIIRLNGLIGQLRGELEKIRLGSVINQSAENLTGTISQLQAALAIERENSKDITKEKESMSKEILDLRRQVKEMENIMIKRSKSGSCIPLGDAFNVDSNEFKELERKCKTLHSDLTQAQATLTLKEQLYNDLQSKYDQDIFKLEQELKKLKKETSTLKLSLEERERGQKPLTAAKEDAHLLATIRGLKAEISSRDRDIVKLNRELDDVRKTNKRLQREREKALNAGNKYRGIHLQKDVEKSPRPESDQASSKDYNSATFEEQETVLFLRSENKSLKEEIRKLEQDLISLHNKRIQDLSDLQEQHESEIARMVREHAAKHSTSAVSHLQGQLYTQQMVIHHLKEQIKVLEERAEEATLLKAERDHLENSLIEANKKIARLHELQSPESLQYSELLEKLDFLERRHEIREQKLQSIVRDLINKQGQGMTCSSDCRDKLLNKNREICYYRAEMDKILDTLAEFRWSK